MKRLPVVIAIAVVFATALLVSSVAAGNGIDLKGHHYNLNLIAGNIKNWDGMQDSNSHVIFVGSTTKAGTTQTRIYLREAPLGEDYDVLDGNGADGTALFQLPKPYLDEDIDLTDPGSECYSQYQIYVRVTAGKGLGSIKTGACNVTEMGSDGYQICTMADGTYWYHTGDGVVTLTKNNKFTQVTHELTTVVIDNVHYGLFSTKAANLYGIQAYFWELFNDDLKTIQLRFYETPLEYCQTTGYP